ncbi:MAG: hypothetical protein HW391_1543 [Chloroflexi bacterium]|nr:hypothetical protein [Chloroflexota bacterium]
MRFWDTSALVPLLITETSSAGARRAYELDPEMITWWSTEVECVSALTRLERAGGLTIDGLGNALRRLDALSLAWHEIHPGQRVREIAVRLLRVHPLRASDALQLAAAIMSAEERAATLEFVTLDDRLADAADREGFPVVRPD